VPSDSSCLQPYRAESGRRGERERERGRIEGWEEDKGGEDGGKESGGG